MSDQSDSAIKEALRIIFGAIGILAGVVAMMFIQFLPIKAPIWIQVIIGVAAWSSSSRTSSLVGGSATALSTMKAELKRRPVNHP